MGLATLGEIVKEDDVPERKTPTGLQEDESFHEFCSCKELNSVCKLE